MLRPSPPPPSAAAQADARRAGHQAAAAMEIACMLLALGFAASFEWQHYFSALGLSDQGPATRAAVAWMLVAKTMFCMLPGLLCGLAAHKLGWRRTSTALFVVGVASVCFWFLVDLRVQDYTGNHVLHYLQFAGGSNFSQWGGGLGPTFRDGALLLATMLMATAASLLVSRRLVALASAGGGRGMRWFSLSAYTVCLTAALLLHRSAVTPLLATALDLSLPVGLPGDADASDGAARTAFGDALIKELTGPLAAAQGGLWTPLPTDRSARLESGPHRDLPDVLVLVLESFRSLSFTPEFMPRLSALSRRGLRLERHFSASNCSQYGLFSLLYGRLPFQYTDAIRQPPQLTTTLAASGYRTAYASSMDHRGWANIEDFINDETFDEMTLLAGDGSTGQWPEHDREVLTHVRELLAPAAPPPRFVFAFLASTHYPYVYPAEYERHLPVRALPPGTSEVLRFDERQTAPQMESLFRTDTAAGRVGLFNRYANAVGFLDDQIADLLETIDLTRTVVIVTGDHGESLWDDGTLAHSSRPSEIETRVPFFMVGAGVPVASVTVPTSHLDVLPTLLHAVAGGPVSVRGLQGRDLLQPGFPGDHIVMTGFEHDHRQALSIVVAGPEEKLSLRLSRGRPYLEVLGSVDSRGNLIDAAPADSDARPWAARMTALLAMFSDQTTAQR